MNIHSHCTDEKKGQHGIRYSSKLDDRVQLEYEATSLDLSYHFVCLFVCLFSLQYHNDIYFLQTLESLEKNKT